MRYHSYLNTAKKIIELYNGTPPLPAFLKFFFAADRKYGSRDRKQIAALCYHYFRLGKAVENISIEERILTGTFLCEQSPGEFLQCCKPEWNDMIAKSLQEKIEWLNFPVQDIFPWKAELSEGADHQKLCESFFRQPGLFLRIRPGKKDIVVKKIKEAGLHFELLQDDCIALPNSSKLDGIIELDQEAVVQDLNSQKVLNYVKDKIDNRQWTMGNEQFPVSCWDCCAASGGKSILVHDTLQGRVELAVSDIRENILSNLKKRFASAGITGYRSFTTDLNDADCQLPIADCQLIICDAPCTGSGTWSREPEQLFYFKPQRISEFAERQKKIVSNVIPYLQKEGLFFYITCSVFKKENEEIAEFIKKEFHLQLVQVEFLKGFDKLADTMFTAVFKKQVSS